MIKAIRKAASWLVLQLWTFMVYPIRPIAQAWYEEKVREIEREKRIDALLDKMEKEGCCK